MPELSLTPEELRLLRMFAAAPRTIGSRVPSWLIEVAVPVFLTVYGTVRHIHWLVGSGLGWLIVLYGFRSFYQFKHASTLASACNKVLAAYGERPA